MKTTGKAVLAVVTGLMALVGAVGVARFAACLQGLAEGLVQYLVARAAF